MHLAAERRESEGRDRHLPRLILRTCCRAACGDAGRCAPPKATRAARAFLSLFRSVILPEKCPFSVLLRLRRGRANSTSVTCDHTEAHTQHRCDGQRLRPMRRLLFEQVLGKAGPVRVASFGPDRADRIANLARVREALCAVVGHVPALVLLA